jgi:hypothetical protein
MSAEQTPQLDANGNPIIKPLFADGRRTPGPLAEGEHGPLAGDVVISKGTPVWRGTGTRRTDRDIKYKEPLDKGEIGSAYRSYDDNG